MAGACVSRRPSTPTRYRNRSPRWRRLRDSRWGASLPLRRAHRHEARLRSPRPVGARARRPGPGGGRRALRVWRLCGLAAEGALVRSERPVCLADRFGRAGRLARWRRARSRLGLEKGITPALIRLTDRSPPGTDVDVSDGISVEQRLTALEAQISTVSQERGEYRKLVLHLREENERLKRGLLG